MAASDMATMKQQVALLVAHMEMHNITRAQLATMVGRTPKHVGQVLSGKAGTAEIDFYAFALGQEFVVAMRERRNGDGDG